jgi:hypothetical protein
MHLKNCSACEAQPLDWSTMYSDDDVSGYMLDLSMVAGALIHAGKQVAPKRYDGLLTNFIIPQEI